MSTGLMQGMKAEHLPFALNGILILPDPLWVSMTSSKHPNPFVSLCVPMFSVARITSHGYGES